MTCAVKSDGWCGSALLAALVDGGPDTLEIALLQGIQSEQIVSEFQARTTARLSRGISLEHVNAVLSQFVDDAAHGNGRVWRNLMPTLGALEHDLCRIANYVYAHHLDSWWSSPMSLKGQVPLDWGWWQRFDLGREVLAASPRSNNYSCWWVTPERLPVTLDSRTVQNGSPWLLDDYSRNTEIESVPLELEDRQRVYEVKCAADWSKLVGSHPYVAKNFATYGWGGPDPRELALPNWAEVAEEWDAVHVSITGYLDAAYRPLPLQDGGWTVFSGWHPGATVWLRAP